MNDHNYPRHEYIKSRLEEADLPANPVELFEKWLMEAFGHDLPEPTAMTLATANSEGRISSRIILLKGFDSGGFQFYTNYKSHKGRDVEENPHAAISFFWPELERQVRVTGVTERLPSEESDEYFNSRPLGSRTGALASRQSSIIGSRQELEREVEKTIQRFKKTAIHRPDYWGGYLILPDSAEFWQGRPDRLHDRISYRLQEGKWIINRLAP